MALSTHQSLHTTPALKQSESQNASPPTFGQHTHKGIAVLLAMTMALGPLALDTYLPAFPAMSASLGVSAHEISLSISIYVFVLAFGQLVAGPLSDRWGRGPIMLTGLALFAIASYLISRSTSLEILLVFRALQAFGGGWATVCVPAIVRDRLSGMEAARFFSLIGLIMIVAPAISPSIGSLLLAYFTWPVIFIVLALYAVGLVVLLKLALFSGQHKQASIRHDLTVWQRYKAVFAVRAALPFMLVQAFSFAVMLLFITHASFIYQGHYGVNSATFSLLFAANVVMILIANLSNRKLLKRYAPSVILRWAITMQAIGVILLMLVCIVKPEIWLFVPAMVITIGPMGAITPNTQASFMEYFSEHGGTASALLGSNQFFIAGSISAASALLPESLLMIVIAQAVCSLICLALIWFRCSQAEVKFSH